MTSNSSEADEGNNKLLMRKSKQENYLTSGLRFGSKKQIIELFWNDIWPRLAAGGWVKGEGNSEGAIVFIPPGVETENSRKGIDYYDRIRDVIDRLQEKRNDKEAKIAESFLDSINLEDSDDSDVLERMPQSTRPIRATRKPAEETDQPQIDVSWKHGSTAFPISCSRVGVEYQVDELPSALSSNTAAVATGQDQKTILYDQVWDPKKAKECGVDSYVDTSVSVPMKEAGMVALHQLQYKTDSLAETVSRSKPFDGSDWTNDERERFRVEIFRYRKDMHKLAKAMNKSLNSCMTYYLKTFKQSDDYRLLKTICAEEQAERQNAIDQQGLDACATCGDGGSLLICDGCEREFHKTCVKPPLASVPEGHWECDDCVDTKFYRARDRLIRNTQVYYRMSDEAECQPSKRRRLDDGKSSSSGELGDKDEIRLRPSPEVLASVKKLAASISKALSTQTPAVSDRLATDNVPP